MRKPLDRPLRFEPFLRPMVWGGRRLGEIFGKSLPDAGPYGESWEVSDHSLHQSQVAEGPWAGQTLRSLMEHERESLVGPPPHPRPLSHPGERGEHLVFPWLIKFLDIKDRLSVQVHPDEAAVQRLRPGEGSKSEAWYVVDAAPGSRIYAGLNSGLTESAVRQALASGQIVECLHSFEPRAGDSIYLPAGTVHAAGGGLLLVEVQQTSDVTFRLFDWNRKAAQGKGRPLQIEEALACIDWRRGPVPPSPLTPLPQGEIGKFVRQTVVRSPYFELDMVRAGESFSLDNGGRMQALVILEGRARLSTTARETNLSKGETCLLPAAMAAAECHPQNSVTMLVCRPPDFATWHPVGVRQGCGPEGDRGTSGAEATWTR